MTIFTHYQLVLSIPDHSSITVGLSQSSRGTALRISLDLAGGGPAPPRDVSCSCVTSCPQFDALLLGNSLKIYGLKGRDYCIRVRLQLGSTRLTTSYDRKVHIHIHLHLCLFMTLVGFPGKYAWVNSYWFMVHQLVLLDNLDLASILMCFLIIDH